jgi:hypothetical protein
VGLDVLDPGRQVFGYGGMKFEGGDFGRQEPTQLPYGRVERLDVRDRARIEPSRHDQLDDVPGPTAVGGYGLDQRERRPDSGGLQSALFTKLSGEGLCQGLAAVYPAARQ